MGVYIIIVVVGIITMFLCLTSFVVVDNRVKQKNDGHKRDETEEKSPDSLSGENLKVKLKRQAMFFKEKLKSLTWKEITILITATFLTGIACFYVQSFQLEWIAIIKVIVATECLMCAAVVDLYTKKIPNKIILAMLIIRFGLMVVEFVYMKEKFVISTVGSFIGLGISFIILILMSLLAKGGFGMGDVKLISALAFLGGIASVFYTVTFGMFVCLAVALILLVSRKKTLKDEIPFGPFIFIGYVISIVLGKF